MYLPAAATSSDGCRVLAGGSEIVELVAVTASRVQHTQVPGTFQGRHEENGPGPGREPGHA